MRIRINALEMQGFKGRRFSDGPARFEFGDVTLIEGDNFQGKSSIGEAIIYALAGVDIEGKANADAQLVNQNSAEMRVKVEVDVNGTTYEIERQVFVSKTKTQTNILINRTKATQAHIDEIIGDKDQLIAAFLPGYYCRLSPSDARAQLMPLLPVPTNEEIMAKLKEDDPQAAEMLAGVTIMDADFYIQQRNTELKEWREEAKRLEGSAEEIARVLKEEPPELRDEEAVKSTVDVLRETIAQIRGAAPKLEDTSELERRRNELAAEYRALQNGLDYEEKWIECPKCGEKVNLFAEQQKRNEAIMQRLREVREEGEKVRAELDAMKRRNEEALAQFKQENEEKLRRLEEQLREATEIYKATVEHNARARLLREKHAEAKKRSQTIAQDIEKARQMIEKQEALIKAAKSHARARVECQMDLIKRHLNRVSIRLFDVVKSTGEMKPTFKLEFDGKEYRRLSKSEKIMCDLEVANLFRKLSGRNYPVFIDDGESITNIPVQDTQVIVAKVVDGMPLTVHPKAEIRNGKIIALAGEHK